MAIKDRLKELRLRAALSQTDIYHMTGISQAQISKFEKGTIIPSIEAILLIAKALKVSPFEIVRDDFSLTCDDITSCSHPASEESSCVTNSSLHTEKHKSVPHEFDNLMQTTLKLNSELKTYSRYLTAKEIDTLDSMLVLCHETLLQEAKKASGSESAKTA